MNYKILIIFQVIAVLAAVNPWSNFAREIAFIAIGIELVLIVFWAIPVFLFHLFKHKTIKESFHLAMQSLIEGLSNVHL
jgi:hypothetical protein